MATTTTSATSASTAAGTAASPVVSALNQALADSYVLMGMTHVAHWNVEGSGFFSLHKAFHEQYEDLFEAIDEMAERVRALDAFPAGGLANFARMSGITEFTGVLSAKDYVAGLVEAHEKTIHDLLALRQAAGDANDLETQDLAIKRLQTHQKTNWMLKSYLK